jgi:uncharacterized OB-fold protein
VPLPPVIIAREGGRSSEPHRRRWLDAPPSPDFVTGFLHRVGESGRDSNRVEVPFVSGIIDCDGTSVRGNLRNVEADADHVHTGMKVRLTTYSLGTDDHGTEAIGFAFEPA